MTVKQEEKLRKQILEIIKGYEPVGHLDGTPDQNVIPAGYDLEKDERTEFGFYWEYEDMEDCASKIVAALSQQHEREITEARIEENEQALYLYRNQVSKFYALVGAVAGSDRDLSKGIFVETPDGKAVIAPDNIDLSLPQFFIDRIDELQHQSKPIESATFNTELSSHGEERSER